MGKWLVTIGLGITLVGILVLLLENSSGGFRLPGDLIFRRKNVTVFLPIGTSILLSIVLSMILWFLNRR